MRFDGWSPLYAAIRADLGYPEEREASAAARLVALRPDVDAVRTLAEARTRLRDRVAVVVGLGPGAGPPPVWRLAGPAPALLAADGAARTCLTAGLIPDVVTTDLDGPVEAEIAANARGALVVLHAHGDNVPALERWAPEFAGAVGGSWSGPPTERLLDVGGFTDGDRAAYLAEACGASRILLWGFDFERTEAGSADEVAAKRRKLAWARRALDLLARSSSVPLVVWDRAGVERPYAEAYGSAIQ